MVFRCFTLVSTLRSTIVVSKVNLNLFGNILLLLILSGEVNSNISYLLKSEIVVMLYWSNYSEIYTLIFCKLVERCSMDQYKYNFFYGSKPKREYIIYVFLLLMLGDKAFDLGAGRS